LTRHSDHHLDGGVPFWKLRPHKGTPTLKWGYYASWWPCVITPIWRKVMTPRIPTSD
jgi:alkane 1-monooxygenase